MTVDREKPFRRAILSRGVSFWAVAAIGLLAAATNAAASPLYRVYQLQFRFSATTLTLLFTVYVVVLLVTLVFLGSVLPGPSAGDARGSGFGCGRVRLVPPCARGWSAIRGSRAAGRRRWPDLRNGQCGTARPAARKRHHAGRSRAAPTSGQALEEIGRCARPVAAGTAVTPISEGRCRRPVRLRVALPWLVRGTTVGNSDRAIGAP